jgi:hypothetical protein
MTFVNSIAEIIHNSVKNYGGQANKNVGDAFLLVWKLKAEDEKINNITDIEVSQENNLIADMALFSFAKIIAKISKYRHILEYNKN